MKRQELKALLHGVENAGEIIDQIMEINGADIENEKKESGTGNTALSRENERLKGEIESLIGQLKAYEKGGEKYLDAAEFQRLKTNLVTKHTKLHNNTEYFIIKNSRFYGKIL